MKHIAHSIALLISSIVIWGCKDNKQTNTSTSSDGKKVGLYLYLKPYNELHADSKCKFMPLKVEMIDTFSINETHLEIICTNV